jgi:uncharacterized alkaline shock family protein YloU
MADTPAEPDPAVDGHPRSAAFEDQRRHVRIETRVLEKIGSRAVLSVPGVIVHSSGISRLTGRRLPRIDVRMDGKGRSASVDAQIAVAWPGPVTAVAQVARETVAEWIEHSTGVPVLTVNIEVAAVVPSGDPVADRVTIQDLREVPRTPALTPVSATPLPVSSPGTPDVPVTARVKHPGHAAEPEITHPAARRPVIPTSVPLPPDPVVTHVSDAPDPVVAHVPTPGRPVVAHVTAPPAPVVQPVPTPVRPPVARPTVPGTPPLTPIVVGHTTAVLPTPPPPPRPMTVPTPPPPPLRNIPTPRGLPVENVPTPEGLPLTVFPEARRHDWTPVTVNRRPRIAVSIRKEKDQ